jgi:hypothetical protein
MLRASPLGAITGLALGLASCGGTPRPVTSSKRTTTGAGTSQARGHAPGAPRLGANRSGIETFGRAAGPADRSAVSAALRAYAGALATDNGAAACSHLAAGVQSQAQAWVSSSGHGTSNGCAQVLSSLFAHETPRTRASQRDISVTAVRLDGDRGFAVFREPGTPVGFFPMQREHGEWKVAALGGSVLPTGVQ